MMDVVMQVAGMVLLAVSIWLGYRQWVAPHGAALDLGQRGILLLLIATLAGGFIGSPFWWADDARTFAWDLPPLGGRMLAAAGWSFVVVCLAALRRPTPGRLRLAVSMLAVYLAPLALAIGLLHRDRFALDMPITYAFFVIVAALIIPALYYTFRPPAPLPGHPDDTRPTGRLAALWLNCVALVTGVWGVALFLTDQGPSPLIWVWPGDALTSRLIGVMLLTVMTGALLSRRSADLARLMLRVIAVYGAGLALASLWGLVLGQPVRPSYAIVFGLIAAISALILVVERVPQPQRGVRSDAPGREAHTGGTND
jgi:hypothetical protein